MSIRGTAVALAAALALAPLGAAAQKHDDPGVSDSEIKIGHTLPLSGPAAATGVVGLAEAAYFAKVNAEGGVNGRKIDLIGIDDGYVPARSVEGTRRLVEEDGVFLIFATQGTPPNFAIRTYLAAHHVPQLFIGSGSSRFDDPKHFPWTIPGIPSYVAEARIYAHYILANRPNARIAVLYQNDDYGRDYLTGLKEGLGAKADTMIVARASYEISDPTVASQIITLQASGADTLVAGATPVAAAQAIRKTADIGWHPLFFMSYISNSVRATLAPAGLDRAKGLVSAFYVKDATDPQWANDKGVRDYTAWMKQYYPRGDIADPQNASGYTLAQLMAEVLKRCGNDLTRANVVAQATHITDLSLPMLFPGITLTLTPDDYSMYHRLQLEQFDGKRWVPLGSPVGG